MGPQTKRDIEERVEKEVHIMLTEGDQSYWKGLSHDGLLEALESELYFLGLYPDEDQETPAVIRDILRRRLDEWWPQGQLIESPLSATTLSISTGPVEAWVFYRSNVSSFMSGEEDVPSMQSDVSPIGVGIPEPEETDDLFYDFTLPEHQVSDPGL